MKAKLRNNNSGVNPKVTMPYKVSIWYISIIGITAHHIIPFPSPVPISTGYPADHNRPVRQLLSTAYVTAQQLIPSSFALTIPPIAAILTINCTRI